MKRSTLLIRQTRTWFGRAAALALLPAMIVTSVPVYAAPEAPDPTTATRVPDVRPPATEAAPTAGPVTPEKPATLATPATPAALTTRPIPKAPTATKVNRTVPKVDPVPARPIFSKKPSAVEITRAHVFSEPLVAVGGTPSEVENEALAAAISTYAKAASPLDLKPFEAFLEQSPTTPWRASLLASMGTAYWRAGRFARAVEAWNEAWYLAKDETHPSARVTADRAIGEAMFAEMRLGRTPALETLATQAKGRELRGTALERVRQSLEGLTMMQHQRHLLMPSAAVAVGAVLAKTRSDYKGDTRVDEYLPPQYGTTLVDARDLASSVGLKLQMASWSTNEKPVVVPSIVHMKLDHYAAIVARDEKRGMYLLSDSLLEGEIWVSEAILAENLSGYALIPEGTLPPGWREVREGEGRAVLGYCGPGAIRPEECTTARCGTGSCPGLATYALAKQVSALIISDVPVGYTPPRGPSVRFVVSYNHRFGAQPQTFTYSNLGSRWIHDFTSFVEDDPAEPNAMAMVVAVGGGVERYRDFDGQAFGRHWDTRNTLVRTSWSPARYELRHPDGSVDVYAQPDGAVASPRRVFLTEQIDPQGYSLQLTYDGNLRLVAISDALGQVTTLSHENADDPFKVTKVTDPFGRFASFDYDGSGNLIAITDIIGLRSEFAYGSGDFISSLTTPYGTSSFRTEEWYDPNFNWSRMVEATDPLGGAERVEYRFAAADVGGPGPTEDLVPTGFEDENRRLDLGNSYYWDKRAMALHGPDYSKAEITRWLKANASLPGAWINQLLPVIHSTKKPLEGRVWYWYAGALPTGFLHYVGGAATEIGKTSQPSRIGRVLDDGSSQIHHYEYNEQGRVTRSTDPLGRATVYSYAANGIDLVDVHQVNGRTLDLLSHSTYNDNHQVLTATDAAGQTTTYSYYPNGQIHTVTNAKNETTTYAYNTNEQLASVTGPVSGTTTTYEYDGYGRLWRVTDPEGYAVTTEYDAFDRPTITTYPDGTYEETVYDKLDAAKQRDRKGRWTETTFDALRRVVSTRDPAGRTTQKNEWLSALGGCSVGCGSGGAARLAKLIDANGNATTWEHDVQGRVVKEIRANNAQYLYTYENTTPRLKQVQDPNGNVKTYTYNLDNSLAGIAYQEGSGIAETPDVAFTYDASYNRVARVLDGTGTTDYLYHPPGVLGAGRLKSVDGPLDADTIEYDYDQLGRVVSKQIGGPERIETQAFDALGRLTTLSNPLGDFTYAYSGNTGRPTGVTYPNGQQTTYAYLDNLGDHRLQEIHNKKPGGATLSKFNYTYDVVGNIMTWRQQTAAEPAKVYEFGYDNADQLTEAILKSTDPTPQLLKRYYYEYDPAGNRTAEQIDDSVRSWTHNNMNQLVTEQAGGALLFKGTVNEPATVTVGGKAAMVTADNRFTGPAVVPPGTTNVEVKATDPAGNVRTNTYQVSQAGAGKSFTFDPNGNMTADGTKTYSWDAENRLVEVKQGATTLASFTYNASSIRTGETAAGVTTIYMLEGARVVEERRSPGGTVRHLQGPGIDNVLLTVDASGTASYYVRDHLASVWQQADVTGQATVTRDYDPWGNLLLGAGSGGDAFTGREWDSEIGLYYYRARYYDPSSGRFISEDPIGSAGGTGFYMYVDANPTTAVDPLGLFSDPGSVLKGLGTGWGIALAEPTPIGEAVMGVLTLGLAVKTLVDNIKDEPTLPSAEGSERRFPPPREWDDDNDDWRRPKPPSGPDPESRKKEECEKEEKRTCFCFDESGVPYHKGRCVSNAECSRRCRDNSHYVRGKCM